jgi:hypothetical protein
MVLSSSCEVISPWIPSCYQAAYSSLDIAHYPLQWFYIIDDGNPNKTMPAYLHGCPQTAMHIAWGDILPKKMMHKKRMDQILTIDSCQPQTVRKTRSQETRKRQKKWSALHGF